MIDESQIAQLVDLALPMPAGSRVNLLDALTRLHLTPAAWRAALPLAHPLLTELDESAADVLARVPLQSIRDSVRARTRVQGDTLGRRLALALAAQHDPAAVPRLTHEFAASPTPDVAEALACVLQPGQGVDAEALRAGLAADDEMTRFWTALAIARVGRHDTPGFDFEPLEQLWDAFVRPAGFLAARPSGLFGGRPPLFDGDPAWAAAQVARVRPLPAAARAFILGLKGNDFDGWTPRHPDVVEDSGAVRAFVSGLTGEFDVYGDPVVPDADVGAGPLPVSRTVSGAAALARLDELLWPGGTLSIDEEARRLLGGLDASTAATVIERALARLAAQAAAEAGDRVPAWVSGNAVVQLALGLPRDVPISLGAILSNERLVSALPRTQLAWVLGRAGEAQVVSQLSSILQSSTAGHQAGWLEWLRDIAAQIDGPAPFMGAFGGQEAPPVIDLIDDVSLPSAPGAHTALAAAPVTTEAAAPPDGEPDAAFLFLLRGAKARRDAICAHSEATLEFRYEVPTADALPVADDRSLHEARRADLDIMLELTTRGNLTLRGARSGVARFKGGAMAEPLAFQLAAGAPDDSGSGVHVDFITNGETVHQHDLTLAVVADEAELARRFAGDSATRVPASLLDDAASAGVPPEHRVRMSLALAADGLRIDLTHWIDGKAKTLGPFVSLALDRARLEALVAGVRADLASVYSGELWRKFDGAVADGDRPALARALAAVAAAGSRLDKGLRESDDALARALDYIETSVPEGAALTIATTDVFLPWEILYPRPWSAGFTTAQKARYRIAPAAFWGVRFAIETVQQHGSGSVVALKKAQIDHAPTISINLNPRINMDELDAARQPLAVQQAWAERLKSDGRLDGIQDQCTVMRSVLQDAASEATLIYVYCHGSAANPFGGDDEMLLLDDDCALTPGDLAGDARFPGAPIIFLNSCQSGAHSPLAFATFLKEFRRRGALGMIAATFPIPIVFGAHFGAEVVDCYLRRRGSLAVALRGLRRTHLLERGNPVPLFYALQCQISFPDPPATGASR